MYMLNIENLQEFTRRYQTDPDNIIREYCEHLFLSYLYQLPGTERLLFKGGTALRIVLRSPRFSEDLDFTGVNITQPEVENLFTDTLVAIEKTAIPVQLEEGKPTSGGYLGLARFRLYDRVIDIRIEVSLRYSKEAGIRTVIASEYLPPYTLVHLSKEGIIEGKMQALLNRHKPRDFYDYWFLLSGNYPLVKEKNNLTRVLALLQSTKINFRNELRQFLPASHAMHLRNFRHILEAKIADYVKE